MLAKKELSGIHKKTNSKGVRNKVLTKSTLTDTTNHTNKIRCTIEQLEIRAKKTAVRVALVRCY